MNLLLSIFKALDYSIYCEPGDGSNTNHQFNDNAQGSIGDKNINRQGNYNTQESSISIV